MASAYGPAARPAERRSASDSLKSGLTGWRWDEDADVLHSTLFKVDEDNFFLYWQFENCDGECLAIERIVDIRIGVFPKEKADKDLRVSSTFSSLIQDPLDKCIVCISTCKNRFAAQDLDNFFILLPSELDAKLFQQELLYVAMDPLKFNPSAQRCLRQQWKKLVLTHDATGLIHVKRISKAFIDTRDDKAIVENLRGLRIAVKDNRILALDLTFEKFYGLYMKMCNRDEIGEIFSTVGSKAHYCTNEQFWKFLNDVQYDPRRNDVIFKRPTLQTAQAMSKKYTTPADEAMLAQGRLSVNTYLQFLMSDDNLVMENNCMQVTEDMHQPLPHYFINSSHNTYLTGNQLHSKSSVQMYRIALLSGCRCLELDCWGDTLPNGDPEPVITHGHTMCTKVWYKDVIQAIKETAFIASEYPVILSFENHCQTNYLQEKMATYCREIFGDLLLSEPLDDFPLIQGRPLPPPSLLKRKILIKNKKKKPSPPRGAKRGKDGNEKSAAGEVPEDRASLSQSPSPTGGSDDEEKADDEKENTDDEKEKGNDETDEKEDQVDCSSRASSPVTDKASEERCNSPSGLVSEESGLAEGSHDNDNGKGLAEGSQDNDIGKGLAEGSQDNDNGEGLAEGSRDNDSGKEGPSTGAAVHSVAVVNVMLSALVNYVQPTMFKSFDAALKENRLYTMSSFSEDKALAYVEEEPVDFVQYNTRQFSRIYPGGRRVESSNYSPQKFWNCGCQLVALNFQTSDVPLQLNIGKFALNGNCGYLLKPKGLCNPAEKFDPFGSNFNNIVPNLLSIKVVSGQLLSRRKCSCVVGVDIYGTPQDTSTQKYKTRPSANNAVNPVWNESIIDGLKIIVPELAVLRLWVIDDNKELLGVRFLPVARLQPGFRQVALLNELGRSASMASIFLFIKINDYVPNDKQEWVDAFVNPVIKVNQDKHAATRLEEAGDQEGQEAEEGMSAPRPITPNSLSEQAMPPKVTVSFSTLPRVKKREPCEVDPALSFNGRTSPTDFSMPCSQQVRRPSIGNNNLLGVDVQQPRPPLPAVPVEEMRMRKNYVKFLRQHRKEEEELQGKHRKEKAAKKKEQDEVIARLRFDFDKRRHHLIACKEKASRRETRDTHYSVTYYENQLASIKRTHDREVQKQSQANQEAMQQLTIKLRHEELQLSIKFAKQEENVLLSIMKLYHAKHLQERKELHQRELKDARLLLSRPRTGSGQEQIDRRWARRQTVDAAVFRIVELEEEHSADLTALEAKQQHEIDGLKAMQQRTIDTLTNEMEDKHRRRSNALTNRPSDIESLESGARDSSPPTSPQHVSPTATMEQHLSLSPMATSAVLEEESPCAERRQVGDDSSTAAGSCGKAAVNHHGNIDSDHHASSTPADLLSGDTAEKSPPTPQRKRTLL